MACITENASNTVAVRRLSILIVCCSVRDYESSYVATDVRQKLGQYRLYLRHCLVRVTEQNVKSISTQIMVIQIIHIQVHTL